MTHAWDDWDPYSVIAESDINAEALLARTSGFAKLAFSLGCAEWVLVRFSRHLRTSEARDYLDACWAYELSANYAVPEELDDELWEGAVRGPVCLALTTVVNTTYGFDEGTAERDAAFAEQLALHVLGRPGEFLGWRNLVLERLVNVFPFDERDPLGPRLPIEVLDPASTLEPGSLAELRESDLTRLHLEGNRFVRRSG